jgi:tetratricopeptide (TPR) repeat protein
LNKDDVLLEELLEKLSSAKNTVEQDAIATEFCLDGLSEEIASIARACVLFHWFDQTVIEALIPMFLTVQLETAQVYEQIRALPFVETFAWGSRFHDLTREELLLHYAQTQPKFLQRAAKFAVSAYEKRQDDKKVALELLFCSIIAGEQEASRKLLSTLQEWAYTRRDWHYLDDLLDIQKEAESFSFVDPLPVNAESWLLHGLASHARGEFEQAMADYKLALLLDPKNAFTHLHRGTAYAEQGQVNRALADYDQALRTAPALIEALVARGHILLEQQNYAEALNDFNAVIRQHVEDPALYYIKGLILCKQAEYQEALTAFDASLKIDPTLTEALVARGRILMEQQNYAEALNDFNAAIQQGAEDPALYDMKELVLRKQKEYQETQTAFDASPQIDPTDPAPSQGKDTAHTDLKEEAKGPLPSSTSVESQAPPPPTRTPKPLPLPPPEGTGHKASSQRRSLDNTPKKPTDERKHTPQHGGVRHTVSKMTSVDQKPIHRGSPLSTSTFRRETTQHGRNGKKSGDNNVTHLTRRRTPFSQSSRKVGIGILAAAIIVGALCPFLFRAVQINNPVVKATATVINATSINATATAKNNVTTKTPTVPANPYGGLGGDLVINDPLTKPDNWLTRTNDSSNGYCQFQNDGYHVRETITHSLYVCTNNREMYSRFIFEVRVALGQGGCGGISWEYNVATGSGYSFFVCRDGTYRLSQYLDANNPVILQTDKANVDPGENMLAVAASNTTLTVYLNYKEIQTLSVQNSSLTGYLGLLADDTSNETENIYTNARLWVFPLGS